MAPAEVNRALLQALLAARAAGMIRAAVNSSASPSPALLAALLDDAADALLLVRRARRAPVLRNQAAMRLLACEPGQGVTQLARPDRRRRRAATAARAEAARTARGVAGAGRWPRAAPGHAARSATAMRCVCRPWRRSRRCGRCVPGRAAGRRRAADARRRTRPRAGRQPVGVAVPGHAAGRRVQPASTSTRPTSQLTGRPRARLIGRDPIELRAGRKTAPASLASARPCARAQRRRPLTQRRRRSMRPGQRALVQRGRCSTLGRAGEARCSGWPCCRTRPAEHAGARRRPRAAGRARAVVRARPAPACWSTTSSGLIVR
ncbi:MAG: hypothetical protein MZW92_72090 [Comamonadaceae bacterium]|nr:hypothetical protein [Comamonadaceae bacterium]